jgi:hypothetical protein
MEDDSSKRGMVIKGPWKDSKVEQEVSEEIDVREDFKMIAEMHKVLLHQLIFTMQDTGYDIESDEFVKESGFLGEVIRAILMRDMGYSNPMSKFINAVVGLDMKDGKSYANFSSDDLIKLLGKKDDKE